MYLTISFINWENANLIIIQIFRLFRHLKCVHECPVNVTCCCSRCCPCCCCCCRTGYTYIHIHTVICSYFNTIFKNVNRVHRGAQILQLEGVCKCVCVCVYLSVAVCGWVCICVCLGKSINFQSASWIVLSWCPHDPGRWSGATSTIVCYL